MLVFSRYSLAALGALALGALGAVAALPAAAWAQSNGDAVVSDAPAAGGDGAAPAVKHYVKEDWSSYAGGGRELKPGEKDDALATPRTRLKQMEDELRLRQAKPRSAPFGQESIIGTDQRKRVTPTTKYPARATALILFSDGTSNYMCTGWLISKDTVATAGHCVADGGSGSFFPRGSYTIYPGRDGTSAPYGSCDARRLSTVSGWINDGRDDYDYAAIKLDCSIGNTTGWYGFTKSFGGVGTPTTVQGYPGDKPKTQWKSSDQVRELDKRRVFYRNDTVGGESGAPVWYNKTSSCNPCSIAIHAYGVFGSTPPYSNNNHGTRINSGVFDNLINWINKP